jgi:hypothetical protein
MALIWNYGEREDGYSPRPLRLELKVQTNQLRLLVYRHSEPDRPEAETLREVFHDPQTRWMPLFVYCKASSVPGLEDVARAYESAALAQYLINPDGFDEAWGDAIIPLRLRQLAAAHSTSLAGKHVTQKRNRGRLYRR